MNPIDQFVQKAAYPAEVERILGGCRPDAETDCLHWAGLLCASRWPRVYVLDPATGAKSVTVGRRGVWRCMTGKAVPAGWRVWGTCNVHDCLNPDHIRCTPPGHWGKHLADTKHYKARPARIKANRLIGQQRRKVQPADMPLLLADAPLSVAAAALGVHISTISRYRRGARTVGSMQTNPFLGLMGGTK